MALFFYIPLFVPCFFGLARKYALLGRQLVVSYLSQKDWWNP